MEIFKPRKFEAIIEDFGLDDGGVASFTFPVKNLRKGEIYYEADPRYIEGNERGVVIDNSGYWHHYGTESFKKMFKEIK